MDNFMTHCHQHPDPVAGCRECYTADDVNAVGHIRGNCIPALCDWHKLDEAMRAMKPPGAAMRLARQLVA